MLWVGLMATEALVNDELVTPTASRRNPLPRCRCATNDDLTEWGKPEYILPVYYYRALPYDPVRPWKDRDGKWYATIAVDGCNSTTKATPCAAGGQLALFKAVSLKGPWRQVNPLFTTNTTKSGTAARPGHITAEFVTPDYIGGLPGDPDGGKTRVVTQSGYWTQQAFWVGQQNPGWPFSAYWDKTGAVGHHDYGDLFMARTLGSESNQVAVPGRRVMIGWISECHGGGCHDPFASQSLPRDLSLSSDYELLQQFVPELKVLRDEYRALSMSGNPNNSSSGLNVPSMQLEVVASFSFNVSSPPAAPFGVAVLGSQDGLNSTKLSVDCTRAEDGSMCRVTVDDSNQTGRVHTGPLLPLIDQNQHPPPTGMITITLHAYVDHGIVEVIWNNRTAIACTALAPNATWTMLQLFGPVPKNHMMETWSLKAAHAPPMPPPPVPPPSPSPAPPGKWVMFNNTRFASNRGCNPPSPDVTCPTADCCAEFCEKFLADCAAVDWGWQRDNGCNFVCDSSNATTIPMPGQTLVIVRPNQDLCGKLPPSPLHLQVHRPSPFPHTTDLRATCATATALTPLLRTTHFVRPMC